MQALASIFDMLWAAKKPFVFFRTPSTDQIVLYFQENDQIHSTKTLERTAFVMRVFDHKDSFFLIPDAKKMVFEPPADIEPCPSAYQLNPTADEKISYLKNIEQARSQIASGSFQKVVLSRRFDCHLADLNPIALFLNLEKTHPDALVYVWYHPHTGGWLGASPERLLVETDLQYQTVALAGTLPKSENPNWSDKEREEQQLVVDAILDGLQRLSPSASIVHSKRYSKTAGNLVHLCTDIAMDKGRLSVLDVIDTLHPTPAVGGLPKKESLDYIRAYEGYDRSFYSGIIGPVSPQNKQLFVNLRCAAFRPTGLSVYVGGGITAASDPEREWQEILRKSETILQWV